jgi:hypothetical protein
LANRLSDDHFILQTGQKMSLSGCSSSESLSGKRHPNSCSPQRDAQRSLADCRVHRAG